MSYVCVCNAVREETVVAAIAAGADTIYAVHEKCHAGKRCCTCHDMIRSLIKKHKVEHK